MKIKELEVGQSVDDIFILESFTVKKTVRDTNFYLCKLRKLNEEIIAIDWKAISKIDKDSVGKIVNVKGVIEYYQGRSQIIVSSMEIADNVNLSEVVPYTYLDIDDTFSRIKALADSIKDTDYKVLVLTILNEHEKEYKMFPAAKGHHHCYIGGLLTHCFSVASICDRISKIYDSFINRDLLIAGAILHDIGKIIEYKRSDIGLTIGRTVLGELKYHPVIGHDLIKQYGDSLLIPEGKINLLQHLLLSHHGKPEYGAAIEPRLVEAEILHSIDELDFLVDVYRNNLENMELGEISGNIYSLGHPIYKHY